MSTGVEGARGDAGRPSAAGRGPLILAFASVYVAWGSTYLAIRIAVASFPPPILAGLRFTIAGAGLLAALVVGGRAVRPSAVDPFVKLALATGDASSSLSCASSLE